MKKNFSNFARRILNLTLAALILCTLSCASTDSSGKNTKNSTKSAKTTKAADIDTKLFYGTWFWDFGYDQNQFANEQLILNRDGTFELYHIQPEWFEYDNGIWSIIDDEEYGAALLLNLKNGKSRVEDELSSIDVKIYFAIHSASENELVMYCYKRDFTAMGWIIQTFNPGVFNHYFKIKDGTAKNLTGRWISNPRGITNTEPCKEIYTFYDDGTVEDMWTEGNNPPEYFKGTYEIQKEKNGNVFHNKMTHVSSDNISFKEINPPMEFWYEYKMIGENLISMKFIKNNINGQENIAEPTDNPAKVDFYYRDIPLETVTYHVDGFTFEDYYPAGTEYELIDQSRPYLVRGVPDRLGEQYFEGWYDNSAFSGNAVTKISASDTGNHEYWAKWSLNLRRSDWIDDKTKEQVHNHEFYLPISLLTPYMEFPESMENNFPSKGDTVYIVLTGKISDDFKAPWQLRIVDQSDGWFMIGDDWHYAEIEKGSFTHVFEVKMTENARTTDLSKIELNLCYWQDYCDEPRTISDFKFEILDGNSPKIIEHTLNYGNFIFKQKSVAGYDFTLPTQPDNLPHQTNYWTQQGNDFLGWYDNPEFKGNPVKSISGAENTKAKTFYGKYNLKFSEPSLRNNGFYGYNRNIPVKAVIPNVKLNPKKGDVVRVAVSANASKDFEYWMGMDLINISPEYNDLGNDWHHVETKDKMLKTFFEIPIQKDANYNSIDDAVFCFMYDSENSEEPLILSDFKFELVDEDPFVTTEAESKHVSIKPCAEGFEITVRKLDSDVKDWTGNFNLYIGNITTEGYETDVMIDSSVLNDKKTVTFIWPFCEKGKTYKFNYSWDDGSWHGEYLKVIASTGKGELNFEPLKKMNITLESNSKEATLSVENFSKEMIMNVVQKYINQIDAIDVDLPFISGKNDWSDTQWLFGAGCRIYPDFDQNNSFYKDLFENGKSNILGEHNFWWGDKEKINNALSERDTFFTDFRIYIRFKDPLEGVSFYTISNRTDNVPYTPVKF